MKAVTALALRSACVLAVAAGFAGAGDAIAQQERTTQARKTATPKAPAVEQAQRSKDKGIAGKAKAGSSIKRAPVAAKKAAPRKTVGAVKPSSKNTAASKSKAASTAASRTRPATATARRPAALPPPVAWVPPPLGPERFYPNGIPELRPEFMHPEGAPRPAPAVSASANGGGQPEWLP